MLLSYRKFIIGAVALICFGYGVVIISGYTLAQLWHQIVEGEFHIYYSGDLQNDMRGTIAFNPCHGEQPSTSVIWFSDRETNSYMTLTLPAGISSGTYPIGDASYLAGMLYQDEEVYSFSGRNLISGQIDIEALPKQNGQNTRGHFEARIQLVSGETLDIDGQFDFRADTDFGYDCID
ncbi:hypothetical protein [Aggregatilinea lenta]|uniref:hypothetical protein n=1 Tax=Aggregatilinea lenta TaxID=913108 RepID=UPI000E5B8383|nr:hypothetical protein [Aggregatilinea lenta]